MASKVPDAGKVERLVKMDYSVAYRENEKLDDSLDERLVHLKRCAHRVLTDKDEELELARADADKILKLKEVVNNRQEEEPALAILCQSANGWRRKSSSASFGSKRKMSTATSASARRISMMSSVRDSVEEVDGENSAVDYSAPSSCQIPDVKMMSLTERRLAKERDQFSAKNLFNVRRKYSTAYALENTKRRDLSPDSSRTNTPTATVPNPSTPSNRQDRPMTSPAAYGGNSTQKKRSYMRPTTAFASRLTSSGEDGHNRPPRRPRSRRELQKLVELKIDPFEEEAATKADGWTSSGDRRQDLLHSLQVGQAQLQARVSAFLRTMQDFNRRDRRSGLEQILEAT